MKILNISDLHVRSSSPSKRLDNFEDSIFNKLGQAFSNLDGIDVICCGSDMFDSFRANKRLIARLISTLRTIQIPFLTVIGNHDMVFRDKINTPISILEAAGVITLLNGNPYTIGNVNFYGCDWGGEVPTPLHSDRGNVNILVIHKMIIKDKEDKLWDGQTEYSTAKGMLKKYPDYQLIVSGDNHKTFVNEFKERTLINPGSLMRNTIAQKDHKPCTIIYDTETREVEYRYLAVDDFENVFDLEKEYKEKEKNSSLEELSELLKRNENIELDFKGLVFDNIKDESEEVKSINDEIFFEEN